MKENQKYIEGKLIAEAQSKRQAVKKARLTWGKFSKNNTPIIDGHQYNLVILK